MPRAPSYHVYILSSRSGVLYVGSTSNLVNRVWQHIHGTFPGFTTTYRVNRLVWWESTANPRAAVAREREIKSWRRAKKVMLIEATNPGWLDLAGDWFPDSGRQDPSLRSGCIRGLSVPDLSPSLRTVYFPAVKQIPVAMIALLSFSCAAGAQQPVPTNPPVATTPAAAAVLRVPTEALVGQQVALMPLTLMAPDPALQADTVYAPYRDRRTALVWADSLIGDAFTGRAPEVRWVLPAELRKVARRSPGIVGDPDQMGQAALRAPKMKEIPDPLRSSLRNLMAVVGGRAVMVPASLGYGREADGRIRADLSLVVGDTRSGKVLWRSLATGSGTNPREALDSALASVLPLDAGGP